MKLSEIIALSKAGFKAAEIRQMIANEETEGQPGDPEPDTDEPGTDNPEDEQPDETDNPEDEQPDDADDSTSDQDKDAQPEPDYKKLYLEEKAKRKKAQAKNTRTEQPDKPKDNDIILNLVNEFL